MHDDERHEMVDYASAIFTVKYSETGMKLFIGDRPGQASVPGQYVRPVCRASMSGQCVRPVCQASMSGQCVRPVCQASVSGQCAGPLRRDLGVIKTDLYGLK